MSWVAVAVAGGAVVGAAASEQSSKTQANALTGATASQQGMFNTVNQQQAPYRQTGATALGQIATGLGTAGGTDGTSPLTEDQVQKIYGRYMGRPVLQDELQAIMGGSAGGAQTAADLEKFVSNSSEAQYHQQQGNVAPVSSPLFTSGNEAQGPVSGGQFMHQFNADDLGSNLSPSYGFMLGQGLTATANMSNLSGGAFSGNTLKAINDYAQNYASTGYQQAYENYNTNQNNIYNRLANIAGLGQVAGSNSATGASAFSSGIAGSTAAAGAARAGGTVGAANALTGGVNSGLGWYSLNNIMNSGNQPAYAGQQNYTGQTNWIEQP